jgi:flagellar motor component MotA
LHLIKSWSDMTVYGFVCAYILIVPLSHHMLMISTFAVLIIQGAGAKRRPTAFCVMLQLNSP